MITRRVTPIWWVADCTYCWTLSGFVYTAFLVDVFSRRIMERDEMIDTVISSHSSTDSRRNAVLVPLGDDGEPYTYLVAKNARNEGIYLVWSGAGSNRPPAAGVMHQMQYAG